MATTPGRLILESIVPAEFRDHIGPDQDIGSKEIDGILARVADRRPDLYRELSHKLLRLGMKGSVETDTSFTLDDLETSLDKTAIRRRVQAEVDAIRGIPDLDEAERNRRILEVYGKYAQELPQMVYDQALGEGSGLARMVAAGARGNKSQLNSSIGMDWAVADSKGRQLPIPIAHGYSEGLTPAEYFATAYGTRLGLISTKFSVQDGGYFSKQISAAASDLIVTEDDCGTDNGIPSDPGDKENVGAVLARDAGGVKAGTILTPKILAEIARANGGKRIVTRSPVSCQAKGGGLCSKCSGVREDNRLPAIGDPVGTNAASGLSMPVQQALLSTKHSAGVVSGGGASQVTGFPQIDALVQVPSTYPNAATLANLDGKVDSVEPAPQGGTWVTVAGERHYVPQDREIKVKPGDVLEAGDVISSGTPNPAEIVRHKGVGAGRAYFVKTFLQTLKDNGTTADRRNTEVIARALINHVRIGDEGVSDRYLPDDIAEYSEMARTYVKPDGSRRMKVREARGKYLQVPVLHYTIGTRIVPSVEKDLEDLDIGEVDVSDDPPPFSPEMIRAMDNPAYKDDLLTHAGQSYVKRNLMADVQSGRAGSDLHGRHIAPAIAKGVELGRPPKGTPGY